MFTEYQGDVSLVVMGEPRVHRFKLCVAAEDLLTLWLEDRVSKLQWQTRELEKTDFVTTENAIPMAKLTDYAKRFAECLSGDANGSSDIIVEWVVAQDRSTTPTLKLVLPLQWSSYVAAVHYLFRMEQVDLKPVDLVAARLSDVEEHVDDLKRSVAELHGLLTNAEGNHTSLGEWVRQVKQTLAEMPRVYGAVTKTRSKTNDVLKWTHSGDLAHDVPRPVEFRADGTILLRADGFYTVVAGIQHTSRVGDVTCRLLYNKNSVYYTTTKASAAMPTVVSSMHYVVEAKDGDELQFVFKGNNEATPGSFVTISRLL